MAGDYTRIHRLFAVLVEIQAGRAESAAALAEEFGVTERSIYRDLDVLRTAGLPIEHDTSANRYRLPKSFFLPPVDLTPDEALALVSLGEHIAKAEQVPLMGAAYRAIAKVRSHLPVSIQDEIEAIERHVRIDLARSDPSDGVGDVYEVISDAIRNRRVLQCLYDSVRSTIEGDGERRRFDFRPYSLFFSQRAWYVIGHHGRHDALRCMKLNRFTGVQLTDREYSIPDGYALADYLGNAWRMIPGSERHNVELQFDPGFADAISETQWHGTQETDIDPRTGELTFRCSVDGLDEIKWWVLSMGPHCKVIAPRELADEVQSLASDILERYSEARGAG